MFVYVSGGGWVSESSLQSEQDQDELVDFDSHNLSRHKYMVGLNLFNRKPEKGINYLIDERFLDNNERTIAEFLFNRNFISKQMIGEYISNTQDRFIRQVLEEFVQLIDFKDIPVDEALRKFQSYFRMPGEAQKIEHLTQSFSRRYCECNRAECERLFNSPDETIEVLAYAIILLNTSIHNPNVKLSEKMKFEQFLKMTKGIDNGIDIDKDYLFGIYERVRLNEFKPGKDHTSSVVEFEKSLVGAKKQTELFALPHRRLICYLQLFEVFDTNKKEKPNAHQRECFLFNDILVISKIFSKKKTQTLYSYREGYPLHGLHVILFVNSNYQYGIRLVKMPERKCLITLNAKNKNDQQMFCHELTEAISEANEIESIRIKNELDSRSKLIVNKKPTNPNENLLVCSSLMKKCSIRSSNRTPINLGSPMVTHTKRRLSSSLTDINKQIASFSDTSSKYSDSSSSLYRTGSECSIKNLTMNEPIVIKTDQNQTQEDTDSEGFDQTDKLNSLEKLFNKNRIKSSIQKENPEKDEIELEKTPSVSKQLSEEQLSLNFTSNNGKYFTISASAGQKFKQIIKKYV